MLRPNLRVRGKVILFITIWGSALSHRTLDLAHTKIDVEPEELLAGSHPKRAGGRYGAGPTPHLWIPPQYRWSRPRIRPVGGC